MRPTAVKRKHINQNRDIIKTNALNQLRIRELEAKVQSLEAERALQALESVALRAHTSRLEHALVSVRRGADVILRALQPSGAGAQTHAGVFDGLGAAAVKREAGGASATVTSMLGQAPFRGRLDGRSFSSPAELSSATESKRSPAMGLGVGLGMGAGSTMGAGNALGIGIHLDSEGHGWPLEPHELPGARIVLDPAALPTGVSKPVARAPEAHLGNVDEADELLPETDTETEQDQRWDAHDFMDEQGETYSTEPGAQQERELYLAPGSARRSSGRRRATPRREATPLTWSTETFSSRTSGFNAEGPPSPVSSPEPTFVPPGSAFGASDFEQQPDRSRTAEPLREPQTPNEASGRTARRASRRQSGLLSIPMLDGSAEDAQAGPSRARDQVEAVEPTESSSNAVHLREVSGDSDSAQNEAVPASAPFTAQALALRDVTNARADATPYSPVKGRKGKIPLRGVASDPNMRSGIDSGVAVFEGACRIHASFGRPSMHIPVTNDVFPCPHRLVAVTPGGRKRKVPSPSGPDEATMLFSPALSSTSASTSNMEDAEGVGGRSRRARKSVNYALPKLNT